MPDISDRLALVLPLTSENYDVSIPNGNFVKLEEAAAWALLCTSSTHPGSPGEGDLILETDTDKLMLRNGASWDHVGTALGGITLSSGKQLNYNASGATTVIAVKMASGSDLWASSRVGAETVSRFTINASGLMLWGDGSSAGDTNLYRTAANFLRTDDSFMALAYQESSLAVSVENTQNTAGTVTSGTYVATLTGGTTCGTTFIAPFSGKVLIHNTCESLNSGAGWTKCAIEVRTGGSIGSGTAVLTANDDDTNGTTGTNSVRCTVTKLITGLTPSATYNVRQLFKVQSGTGTFLRKQIVVEPKMI